MKKFLVSTFILLASLFLLSASPLFAQDYCNGNFDCDEDVDGSDAAVFKSDFGRSPFKNPCPGCPPPAPVPKTGQTTCFDENGLQRDCTGTGEDGDWEKGITWPNPRFRDDLNGTITDNLTGLIWLKNANCYGLRTWSEAITDCHNLGAPDCGLSDASSGGDWRLPNMFELASLLDMNFYDPALSNSAGTGQWTHGDPFTNLLTHDNYWSSTTDPSFTSMAKSVSTFNGSVGGNGKYYTDPVWCVRGGH